MFLLLVFVPNAVAVAICRALLTPYCRRQNPSWPFVLAALLGGLAGVISGFNVVAAFSMVSGDASPNVPVIAGLIQGVPVGIVVGACAGVGVASCFKGPLERRIGAVLGALAGWALGFPLMELVPYSYLHRLGNFEIACV